MNEWEWEPDWCLTPAERKRWQSWQPDLPVEFPPEPEPNPEGHA